jgi:hypothetical protein
MFIPIKWSWDLPKMQPRKASDFVFAASWFCVPELEYCGAPAGYRCSCGKQREGHDPGDEDAGNG